MKHRARILALASIKTLEWIHLVQNETFRTSKSLNSLFSCDARKGIRLLRWGPFFDPLAWLEKGGQIPSLGLPERMSLDTRSHLHSTIAIHGPPYSVPPWNTRHIRGPFPLSSSGTHHTVTENTNQSSPKCKLCNTMWVGQLLVSC